MTAPTAAPTELESTLVGDVLTNTSPAGSSQDAAALSTEAVSVNTDVPQAAEASTSGQGNSSGDSAATIDSLRKELRAMKKFKVMWAKQQQEQNALPNEGGPSVPEGSIPRPPGERGKNGWNMQTALQLEADGDTYNLILATARDAVRETGLDWKKKFDEQDPMKHVQPYLRRFKGDWACRELVISTLQNRQKVEHARIKALMVRSPSKPSKSKRTGFKPRSKSASTASPAEELINDEDVREGEGEEA
ncbi:hypothetical protein M407DRAFT_225582 [Tulasnella calospora MUT 4182]|uniref:Uncharacterized protein n=1 Tax=Tulasnella calospora MUT 4182 TaxID=1051891 RepID=A0A0C3KAM2_9AGAM|nr:hypothetical protein M407DRAFT_225582 [Tulasnella calospora MUT 4182]